jgi:DNA adenine methylase
MKSPIKYFGGKNGFANKILEHFPTNYQNLNYIEPFCGSAAMLFHKEGSPIEIINDLDSNITTLFQVLIDEEKFSKFRELLNLTPYSEELHYQYFKELPTEKDPIQKAYKYFYINRTAYNGLGGFSITSHIRRGMPKSVSDYLSAIDNLPEIHNRLSKVIILNRDAIELIKKWDVANTFIYLDSPYANETRTGGRYKFDFTDEMQDKYIQTLLEVKSAKLLISGYNCPRYGKLEEAGFTRHDMEIRTQNNNRVGKSKTESLWKNYS